MTRKKPPRINKTPYGSGLRKVLELLAAKGPMYTGAMQLDMPAMPYDSLKKCLKRAEEKRAITVTRHTKPYCYAVTLQWREILDASEKPPAVKRLPDRIPAQHPLVSVWHPAMSL